jgi:hypothetical protein
VMMLSVQEGLRYVSLGLQSKLASLIACMQGELCEQGSVKPTDRVQCLERVAWHEQPLTAAVLQDVKRAC